jgi:hypothetical protein
MEYWLSVVDELADQIGIVLSEEKRDIAASIIQSAASVHGEYSSHSEPERKLAPTERRAEPKRAWWEDVSNLSGSDWVLARQIHNLIASRHA